MKDLYDLTAVPALSMFPWDQVVEGLARAEKTVTTFYGDVHNQHHHLDDGRWRSKSEWRWFNALKLGIRVEGFNVNLTTPVVDTWWARVGERGAWQRTPSMDLFPSLMNWLEWSQIFEHTGRIVFFIQLNGQSTPKHIDFDRSATPAQWRDQADFLWLSPPENCKQLHVGEHHTAPWACFFNTFLEHWSDPQDRPQWSLRIDGKFTDTFRNTYIV